MTLLGALDPCVAETFGELFINDVSMNTPAWNVLSVLPLITNAPANRGDNIVISGIAGQRAYPMELEQTDYILSMMVSGVVDMNGNPDGDGSIARLFRNFAYLRANVYGPVDGTTSTWYSYLLTPWGDLYEADVQVLDIAEVYEDTDLVKVTLTIRVPAGEYELSPAS